MKKRSFLSLFLFLLLSSTFIQAQDNLPKLLIRVDDIGMNHSVNLAVKELAETKIPFSASIMFACPWYQEAVDILKQHPHVSVGIHLTLTAEWKHYRWGPVLGRTAVPSLVDSLGYFRPSVDAFLTSKYKVAEIEKELTAQIERALGSGLKITYMDPHMGIAYSTPEISAITEKLAKKYKLGLSTYFNENYVSMWGVPVDTKQEEFLKHIANLTTEKTNLVELHIAKSSPEMEALVDMNSPLMSSETGAPQANQHRQTELNMVLTPEFSNLIGKKFKLVTYSDVIRIEGLDKMKKPKF